MWNNLDSYGAKKSKTVRWMSRIIRNKALNMVKPATNNKAIFWCYKTSKETPLYCL
ncbi:hypothetical protein [Candidatus Njordibacter sp. Uisw_002]|uniref:hypothetical protein n=1 Tax=Candidatus Njordibacter sp. Uisw_002 TaxID=3230971 RepID=UPI003D4BBE4A